MSLSHTRLLNDQARQFFFPNSHDACKQIGEVVQIIDGFELTDSLSNTSFITRWELLFVIAIKGIFLVKKC